MLRKLNRSKLKKASESSTAKQLVDKELLRRDGQRFVPIPSQKRTAIVSPIFREHYDDDDKRTHKSVVSPALAKKPVILKRNSVMTSTKDNYKHTVQNSDTSKSDSHRNKIKLDRSNFKMSDSPHQREQKCQTIPISTDPTSKSKSGLKRKFSVDSSSVSKSFYTSTPKDRSETVLKQELTPLTKGSKNALKYAAQSKLSTCNLGHKNMSFKSVSDSHRIPVSKASTSNEQLSCGKKISFRPKSVSLCHRIPVPKAFTSNKQLGCGKNKVTQSHIQTKYDPVCTELNKSKILRNADTSLEALRKGVSSSSWVQVNHPSGSKHSSHLNKISELQSNSTRVGNSRKSDYKSTVTKHDSSKKRTASYTSGSLSSTHSNDTRVPSSSKHQTRQTVSPNKMLQNKVSSCTREPQTFRATSRTLEGSSCTEERVAGYSKIASTSQASSNALQAKSSNTWQDMFSKTNKSTLSIPNLSQSLKEQDISEESDVEMLDVSANLRSLDILNVPMEIDNVIGVRKSYIFVVDTNMLIHDLNFIDELKDTPLEGCGPPYIHIPWIVICELDRLKTENNSNKFKIIQAVRYVFFMFNSKHPRIKGQTARLSKELSQCFGTTGDDVLLSYCSWLAQKICKDKVCLLTNDKNLCNKGFMNGIKVFTRKTLYENIKPDVSLVQETIEPSNHLSQINDNANGTDVKVLKEQMAVDGIICEAKLILKNILEPFLIESMTAAFGESSKTFLTPPPSCLIEIFQLYKKYWLSVFGIMFDRTVKQKIETLLRLFSFTRGFFCSLDDAFAALIAIEHISNAIMRQKPNIRPHVNKISELTDKCKTLFKTEENKVDVADNTSGNEIVMAVFTHIWALINHLCGMILDFSQMPHDLQYVRPETMPSAMEFKLLVPNLFPAVHLIKQTMSKIINSSESAEPSKGEIEYKRLYDYLIHFVPTLQIPAEPPPTEHFTVQLLKAFCNDPEYRVKFKNGYQQLLNYQRMLIECLRKPLWRQ